MFDHKKWTKTKIDNSTQQYVLFDKIILITYQNWNGVPNKVGRVNRLNMIGNDKRRGVKRSNNFNLSVFQVFLRLKRLSSLEFFLA